MDVIGHTGLHRRAGAEHAPVRAACPVGCPILQQSGVDGRRFFITGMGPDAPIASNATDSGRALNRRVEIKIAPPHGQLGIRA